MQCYRSRDIEEVSEVWSLLVNGKSYIRVSESKAHQLFLVT
jgi:hypothetical protein